MFQELRKKLLCETNKNSKSYGPLNIAVKKGLRRLTWLQSSHSFETEIKPIFLINKNVIRAGTKEKKKQKTNLKMATVWKKS